MAAATWHRDQSRREGMSGTGRQGAVTITIDDATIDRAAQVLRGDAEAKQLLAWLWKKSEADSVQRGMFRHFVARCVAALEASQAKA